MTKKIKFIKDCDEGKIGLVKNYSNNSADSFVEQGYAKYIEKPKKKIVKKKPTPKKKIKTAKQIESILKTLVTKSLIEQEEEINKLSKENNKTKTALKETLKRFQKEHNKEIEIQTEILKEIHIIDFDTVENASYYSLKSDLEGGCSKLINSFKNNKGLYPEELKSELIKNLSIIPSFKKYPNNYLRWAKKQNKLIIKENKIQKTKEKINEWADNYKENPIELDAKIKEFAQEVKGLYNVSDLKKLINNEIKRREEETTKQENEERQRFLEKKRAEEKALNVSKKEIVLPSKGKLISTFARQVSEIMKDKNKIFFRLDSREIVEIGQIKEENDSESYTGFLNMHPRRFITLIENYMIPGIELFNEYRKVTEFFKKSMTGELSHTLLSSEILQESLPKIERLFSVPIPIFHEGQLTFPIKGYDPRFNSWLNHNAPNIKDENMSLEEAKEVIYNLLKEFCFQSHQDYINSIAALLTPYLRGLFSSFNTRTPVWVYIANRERAGKDYLAGITGMLYEGHSLEEPPICNGEKQSSNNDELKKKILAAMISGRKRLHFANNKGFLNNAVFEAVITAEKYSDRLLGRNEILTFDNELDFSISGNMGIGFTPDFANRARFIRLFLDIEDANSRSFENPNLHRWIKMNRELILSALYSLIKNWINKEMPKGKVNFASFPEWAEVCGGVMEAAGYGSPCVQDKEVLSFGGDNETKDMKRLFEIGFEKHPEGWIKKSDIKRLVIDEEDLFGYLDFTKKSDQTKFGSKLTKFIGRVFSEVRLLVKDTTVRSSRQEFKFTKEIVEKDKKLIFDIKKKNKLPIKMVT